MRIEINKEDKTEYVASGFSIYEKLHSELDEGHMSIPYDRLREPYQMYSAVDFYEDGEHVKRMRVMDDDVKLTSKTPMRYRHEIGLIENTYILERYRVEGMTFTQPLEGSKYTLLDNLKRLQSIVPDRIDGERRSAVPFKIRDEDEEFLSSIVSKEHTFTGENLREVLNTMLSQIDAVARLDKDGYLRVEFLDISKSRLENIEDKFVHERFKKDSEYYATSMNSDVQNAIYEQDFVWYPAPGAYATARSDEVFFNPESASLPTPRPIYEVLSVNFLLEEVTVSVDGTNYSLMNFETFMNNRVVEEQEHRTLPSSYSEFSEDLSDRREFTQENVIKYKYGEKGIDISNTYGIFDGKLSINRAMICAVIASLAGNSFDTADGLLEIPSTYYYDGQTVQYTLDGQDETGAISVELPNSDFAEDGEIAYNILYRPIKEHEIIAVDRTNVEDIKLNSQMSINQRERIIDLSSYKDRMKSEANRMSNQTFEFDTTTRKMNGFQLGDYYEKYVITEKEIVHQNTKFRTKYRLSKDYSNISKNTGIHSETREWEIGESDRTLERPMVYNEYIQVSEGPSVRSASEATNTSRTLTPKALEYFGKVFEDDFWGRGYSPYGIFRPKIGGEYTKNLLVGMDRHTGGGTMSFSFRFYSNVSAGDRLDPDNNFFSGIVDRNFQDFVRYTEEDGELEAFRFEVHENVRDRDYFDDLIDEAYYRKVINTAKRVPEIETGEDEIYDLSEPIVSVDMRAEKDRREALSFSMNYHVVSSDMIIGSSLTELNPLIIDRSRDLKIRFYTEELPDNIFHDVSAMEGKTHIEEDFDATYFSDEQLLSISTGGFDENWFDHPDIKSYAIIGSNGDLYLAKNNPQGRHLYIDAFDDRPGVNYTNELYPGVAPTIEFIGTIDLGDGAYSYTWKVINNEDVPVKIETWIDEDDKKSETDVQDEAEFTASGGTEETIHARAQRMDKETPFSDVVTKDVSI